MKPREMHITLLQPAIDWSPVWGNLLNTIVSDGVRSTWWLMTLYPSMCDCRESDYQTRRTVAMLEAGHHTDRLTECRDTRQI